MNRTLFYISVAVMVLNAFCTITAFNVVLGIFNAIIAITLFIQLLTYDLFKPYRDEIKNACLNIIQWFKK